MNKHDIKLIVLNEEDLLPGTSAREFPGLHGNDYKIPMFKKEACDVVGGADLVIFNEPTRIVNGEVKETSPVVLKSKWF
jgi:hypothetical protein